MNPIAVPTFVPGSEERADRASSAPPDVAAWSQLFEAASAHQRSALGLEVEQRGPFVALRARGVPSLLYNRVFVVGHGPARQEDLDSLLSRFASAGIMRYLVHVPASASAVHALLERSNLQPFTRKWVKFVRDAAPPRSYRTPLAIEAVSRGTAVALAETLCFGLDIPRTAVPLLATVATQPGWSGFVARDGTEVVAGALAFLQRPTGYLFGAATLPSHRQRGAQSALMAARIAAARSAGCSRIATETGELRSGEPNHSYRNLLRAGFCEAAVVDNYAPAGTAWSLDHSGE